VLAFDFTEKCQCMIKIDRNSIFLECEAHIQDQLHIMVLYIFFMNFIKFKILVQNLTETLYLLAVKLIFWIVYT
jgi:hypothetical protein